MGDLVDSTMRTSSILLPPALLALLSVAAFAAEEKVESVDDNVEAEDDPAKEGKEELAKMDTNKDGKADLAEVTEYMKKEFYGPEDIKEDNMDDVDSELDEAEDEDAGSEDEEADGAEDDA